jgi:hypothetical protein
MRNGRNGRRRLLLAMAVASVCVGGLFVAVGTASAQSRVGATAQVTFWPSFHEVTLTVPSPPCPTSNPSCTWLLEVNEPDVPAQTVLGSATGNSGILTVTYPADFCGVIQADALIGPSPWYLKYGHKDTVGSNCDTPVTSATPVTSPANTPSVVVPTSQLPYSATVATPTTVDPTTGTTAPATANQAVTATTVATQLPFTGVNVKPLALVGAALILAGLYVLTTIEQRRRALARVGASVRSNPVGVKTSRITRWFLGD